MQTWTAKLLCKASFIIGEGACWHPGWEKFLFVDIEGKKVCTVEPYSGKMKIITVNKRVGTVVPAINNRLLVAMQGSIEELDFETGNTKILTSIETDKPSNRCNEGKCDAAARFWVGTMDVNAALHKGALYCYNGSLSKKLENISISNGICWNHSNTVMYYIDSFDYNIKSYDFNLYDGSISNERIVAEIKEPGWIPDGMTIDADGMLWVAMWGGFGVYRFNPANGLIIGKVTVDVPQVTACAFGGKNLQHLFITTAIQGLTEEQLKKYPLSGSLFITDTGIKGTSANYFRAVK